MNLEDRLRETLRLEAERSSQAPHLQPVTSGTRNLRVPIAVAGFLAVLTVGLVLGQLTDPGDLKTVETNPTLAPPITTVPDPTTVPASTTVPDSTTSTERHVPPTIEAFHPEVVVANGGVQLELHFHDGSWALLEWPEDLDLLAGGVKLDGGYAVIPHKNSADFIIRRGRVEDVVALFGRPQVIQEESDGRGGIVRRWRPTGWPVDFWGFQFGDWAVLAHAGEYGATAEWAPLLRGETTSSGFLRLYADEPLRLAPAPGYSAPYSVSLGGVELIPGECDPERVATGSPEDWCDGSGLVRIRVGGPPTHQLTVYEGLVIKAIHVAGISGPDSTGSYAHLADALDNVRQRWRETGPSSYRLTISYSPALHEVVVDVRNGVPQLASGMAAGAMTVEELFNSIEAAIAGGARYVEARFHEWEAYPTRITIDAGAIDAWGSKTITLSPLDDSAR